MKLAKLAVMFVLGLTLAISFTVVSYADYSFMADYIQRIYSEESAIPVTSANYVLQTSDKFIWIASYDGLFRFDGKSSVQFDKESFGFPTKNVNVLFEDSKKRLWIGTNDSGIAVYFDHGITIFDTTIGLSSNSVRSFTEDQDGNIYIATSSGLDVINNNLELMSNDTTDLGTTMAFGLTCSKENEIWCVQNDKGVNVLTNNKTTFSYAPDFFDGYSLNSIYKGKDDTIYIGTLSNKFIKITDSGDKGGYEIIDTGKYTSIQNFYEDSDGRLWFCTTTGLGYYYQGKIYEVDGLEMDASLVNIIQDNEENYWLTSSRRGLLCFTRCKFTNISFKARLPELTVNTTKYVDEDLYIGTDTGLYIINKNDELVENDITKMLSGSRIRAIISDNDGFLWFCCYNEHSLSKYNPKTGELKHFDPENDGLTDSKTRCAKVLHDGSIAVGTNNGLSIIKDDKVIKSFGANEGILNSYVLCIEEDADGKIYVGSDGGGIYIIDGDTVTNFNEANGLPAGIILRLKYDPARDAMWVSSGNSLCIWTGDEVYNISDSIGVSSSVFDIIICDDGEMLLLTAEGVYFIDSNKLFEEKTSEVKVLKTEDGLLSSITANSWNDLTENDILYLACSKGVFSLDIDDYYTNNVKPDVKVMSVVTDDQKFDTPEKITVNSSSSRITINLALLTYNSIRGNTITYMLKGFDNEPVTINTSNELSVSYTNLKGGDYTFVVSGVNNDGISSDYLEFIIKKELSFFEHPIVIILLIAVATLALFLVAFGYAKHKIKKMQKREDEYRQITEQAISAIADTIDAKDTYTAGHSRRVAQFSVEIGRRLGLGKKDVEDLYYTALLHDIGKIGVPDSILKKPSHLNDEEYKIIQSHVEIGGSILQSIEIIENVAIGAKYHHERYDGKGYTQGLSGENIPLFARIICVADTYDAMSSDRPYRKALGKDHILNEIKNCSGTQFDPKIAGIMVGILNEQEQ